MVYSLLVNGPSLIGTSVASVEDNVSVVVIMSSMNIETLSCDVSDVLDMATPECSLLV